MMTFRLRHLFARGEKLLPAIAVATALAITAPVTLGAASAAEASPAQTVGMPDWQQAAGGKSSFEVASIRPSKPGTFTPPTFPLSADASYGANTDTFIGDFPLEVYIEFAYKMRPTRDQVNAMLAPLPKWVGNESFTIHAKAAEPATKDQMRLMMQSLLAERFGLRLHFETQEVPVLVLTLEKAGRIGPNLHPHTDGPPCNRPASEFKAHGSADGGPDVFPSECDVYSLEMQPNHLLRAGSRDTTMDLVASSMPSFPGAVSRPVVNRTGLSGRYDFRIEWAPEQSASAQTVGAALSDAQGPTFLEAVKEQLGLALKPTKAPLSVMVIDHVSLPTQN